MNQYGYNTEPATPAIAVLRKNASSTLTLVLAILLSATAVLSLIGGILSVIKSSSVVDYGMYDYYVTGNATAVGAVIGTCISMIPLLLLVIGVWLYYCDSKRPVNAFVNPRGLTFIKAVAIIGIVLLSVVSGLLLIAAVIFAFVGNAFFEQLLYEFSYYYPQYSYFNMYGVSAGTLVAMLIVGLLIILAIIVLMMFVYIMMLKSVNSIKMSSVTGEPATKISMFLIVMLFISGGAEVITSFGAGSVILVFGALAGAATTVVGAVALIKLRREMLDLAFMRAQSQQAFNQVAMPMPPQPGAVCGVCGKTYDPSLPSCPYCKADRMNNDGEE